MYERILLPTDGSERTETAFRHAQELAGTYDATLHVLSVVDIDSFAALDGVDMDSVRSNRSEAVDTVADRATEQGVTTVTALREGTPADEILDYIDKHDIDMLVMGTQGRSGVDRVLVGSVTESVIRRATVPVVTVRQHDSIVATSDEAVTFATEALESEGHDNVELAETPHRTSGSWIVPLRAPDGTFHVHVDTEDGTTRIARLD